MTHYGEKLMLSLIKSTWFTMERNLCYVIIKVIVQEPTLRKDKDGALDLEKCEYFLVSCLDDINNVRA